MASIVESLQQQHDLHGLNLHQAKNRQQWQQQDREETEREERENTEALKRQLREAVERAQMYKERMEKSEALNDVSG